MCGVNDPCGLYRPRPAVGVAGAPREEGPLSRRLAYRLGRTGTRVAACGGPRCVTWRWRSRWHGLPTPLEEAGWSYVCRTGCHLTASWEGATFRLDALGAWSKPGTLIALQEVRFTEAAYGPVMLVCCWAKGYQEPLYLVSNLAAADEACSLYAKRFRIATFFSDQKSRGFHLHTSPLSAPQRLSRLWMAAC